MKKKSESNFDDQRQKYGDYQREKNFRYKSSSHLPVGMKNAPPPLPERGRRVILPFTRFNGGRLGQILQLAQGLIDLILVQFVVDQFSL